MKNCVAAVGLALICCYAAQAQEIHLSETNDVRTVNPLTGKLELYQSTAYRYDVAGYSGTTPIVLTNSDIFALWWIQSKYNPTHVVMVATGTVLNATNGQVRFEVDSQQMNVLPSNYYSFVRAYRATATETSRIATLSFKDCTVQRVADSGGYQVNPPLGYPVEVTLQVLTNDIIANLNTASNALNIAITNVAGNLNVASNALQTAVNLRIEGAAATNNFVDVTGDTMTGGLTIESDITADQTNALIIKPGVTGTDMYWLFGFYDAGDAFSYDLRLIGHYDTNTVLICPTNTGLTISTLADNITLKGGTNEAVFADGTLTMNGAAIVGGTVVDTNLYLLQSVWSNGISTPPALSGGTITINPALGWEQPITSAGSITASVVAATSTNTRERVIVPIYLAAGTVTWSGANGLTLLSGVVTAGVYQTAMFVKPVGTTNWWFRIYQ